MTQHFHLYSYPRQMKTDVHTKLLHKCSSNIIHKSQEVETTQMSINRWMDEQSVVYEYNGILFSFKKEEILTYTTPWMNLMTLH